MKHQLDFAEFSIHCLSALAYLYQYIELQVCSRVLLVGLGSAINTIHVTMKIGLLVI